MVLQDGRECRFFYFEITKLDSKAGNVREICIGAWTEQVIVEGLYWHMNLFLIQGEQGGAVRTSGFIVNDVCRTITYEASKSLFVSK